MATVLVDISEKHLVNFSLVNNMKLEGFDEKGHKRIFKELPFTLYQNRMMGDHMITMNIPLNNFLLFKGYNLIK